MFHCASCLSLSSNPVPPTETTAFTSAATSAYHHPLPPPVTLTGCVALKQLSLHGLPVTSSCCGTLASLVSSGRLTHLCLTHCGLTSKAATLLANAIAGAKTMDATTAALLMTARRASVTAVTGTGLRHLNLRGNAIGDKGVRLLWSALQGLTSSGGPGRVSLVLVDVSDNDTSRAVVDAVHGMRRILSQSAAVAGAAAGAAAVRVRGGVSQGSGCGGVPGTKTRWWQRRRKAPNTSVVAPLEEPETVTGDLKPRPTSGVLWEFDAEI